MTPEELLSFTELFYSANIALMRKKNADYSGGVADAHANFKALETMSGIPNATAIGFLTRMMDKYMRVVSFVQKGKLEVEDEGVKDSLADLANYCALMAAWIADQQEVVPQDRGKQVHLNHEAFSKLTLEEQNQVIAQKLPDWSKLSLEERATFLDGIRYPKDEEDDEVEEYHM